MNETYDNIKKAVTKDVLREVKVTFYSKNWLVVGELHFVFQNTIDLLQ